MRIRLIAASALALIAADGASAQRMVMQGPGVGSAPIAHTGYAGTGYQASGSRWGSRVGGHWWGGMNAPGGWNAYRRPHRGWNLPSYWVASDFAIGDWQNYGLGEPPAGYGWTRYYDDAVLIDGNGRVYDCVSNVDWNRGGSAYDNGGQGYDTAYAGQPQAGYAPGYVQPTYGQSTYAPQAYAQPAYPAAGPYAATSGYAPAPGYAPGAGYAPPAYVQQRNSGVGGALVGAAVGGVAGNLIAGRGNRLAGTLIGAGVGGVAGYAIDRSSSHRVPVAQGYGYAPQPGYAPGYAPGYPAGAGYAPPPPPPPGPAGSWHSPDGGTVVTTSSVGGYYGGSTTVVTVQTAPVVTTTTTEITEDAVTYTRHRPVHHKWVRRRPPCGC